MSGLWRRPAARGGADARVHPFLAGLWARYGELLAREFGDPAYFALHQVTVDAYAVQHPGVAERRAIQSVGLHLMTLCMVLEQGADPAEGPKLHSRMAKRPGFEWLDPPAMAGRMTVVDVLPARSPGDTSSSWGRGRKTCGRRGDRTTTRFAAGSKGAVAGRTPSVEACRRVRGAVRSHAPGATARLRQIVLPRSARHLFIALAAAIALGALAVPAAASTPRPGTMIEKPVRSAAPDADRVAESYVRLYKPLPESAGPHPARCDWVGYLRFRSVDGPRNPSRADAIFVSMPGLLAGASMHDQLARNVVRSAGAGHAFRRDASGGRAVEYWALDRRANCLEDHRGVDAAAGARDPRVAFDYYFNGRAVNGKRFGGFRSASDASFLSDVGLEQTVRDEYAVIKHGIPSRRTRRQKVFCGGHSLGGPLTTAFAGWDFDGDPRTRRDAGYKQCAGLFGLDTSLGFDSDGGSSQGGISDALAQISKGSPFLNVPPFTPETIQILGPLGVGSFFHPRGTRLIDQIPHTPNIDLSQRVLFSRDAVNFATGQPSIRDFRLTNQTVLAGIFDDNSNPITILRTSLGTTDGGPVAQKNFPTPGSFGLSGTLVNNKFLMIPAKPRGPLYRWRNYDRLDAPGAPAQRNDAGDRYTSAKSEVADIRQLGRNMFEAPADFSEQYFPTRILTDVSAAEGGDRGGSLKDLRYDGVAKRPAFLIQAGDSDENTGADPKGGSSQEPPNDDPRSGVVSLPGYNHIDVVNAAWRQRGGRAERSSKRLVDFGFGVRRAGAR